MIGRVSATSGSFHAAAGVAASTLDSYWLSTCAEMTDVMTLVASTVLALGSLPIEIAMGHSYSRFETRYFIKQDAHFGLRERTVGQLSEMVEPCH